jgi:hypothetical protein
MDADAIGGVPAGPGKGRWNFGGRPAMVKITYVSRTYLNSALGASNSLSFLVSGMLNPTDTVTVALQNANGSPCTSFEVDNPAQFGATVASGLYAFSSTIIGEVLFGGYVSNISMTVTCEGTTTGPIPIPTFPTQQVKFKLKQKAKGEKAEKKGEKAKAKQAKTKSP